MIRQLRHESDINLRLDGVVLVVSPIILKVVFESLRHVLWQRTTLIEMSEKAEPFREILTVFIISSYTLKIHQNVNELTHDVRECGNTDEKDESCHDTLNFTLRVEISKTNGRQGREGKVDYNDKVLPLSLVTEPIFIIESELWLCCIQVSGMLSDDIPERAKEVTEDQNEENEAEDSEDVHDIDLVHNLIVII